jgi:hypothetical protein
MSRDYAKTNVTIWQDSDFRALPFPAQHLYMTMWAHPELSYCGVLDWRPGRLAALAAGWDAHAIRTFADCLASRHFIVIDEETEEVLVRSWVRWEEILKQPRLSVSYVKAFSVVASNVLRSVLVHELTKIKKGAPELVGFKDQRVLSVLDNPSVSAKDLPVPSDPFANGLTQGLGLALGQGLGQTLPSVCLPPTPAPTPTPLAPEKKTGSEEPDYTEPKPKRRSPKVPLPHDWSPNDRHRDYAQANRIDIDHETERFRNRALANDERYADWSRAFTNWLSQGKEKGWARILPLTSTERQAKVDQAEQTFIPLLQLHGRQAR